MSLWDSLQGVTEPEFLILSRGLGHLTPNLGFLAESAKGAREPEMTAGLSREEFFDFNICDPKIRSKFKLSERPSYWTCVFGISLNNTTKLGISHFRFPIVWPGNVIKGLNFYLFYLHYCWPHGFVTSDDSPRRPSARVNDISFFAFRRVTQKCHKISKLDLS